jgi:hypothetical protein
MSDDIGKLADEVVGRLKTTDELKHVPFEMYARIHDRALRAEAREKSLREALKEIEKGYTNATQIARAALAPSPAGREAHMSGGEMTACPPDSDLMRAWEKYQATDDFKNSLYWATTETVMRKERAAEQGVPPEANIASGVQREQYAKGSLWAAFVAGFGAALAPPPV